MLPESLEELENGYLKTIHIDPSGGTTFMFINKHFKVADAEIHPRSSHWFEFEFVGTNKAIEVPFHSLTPIQRLRDGEGRLPPMLFLTYRRPSAEIQQSQQNLVDWIWSYGLGGRAVIPLDLPAEQPPINDGMNPPADQVEPAK